MYDKLRKNILCIHFRVLGNTFSFGYLPRNSIVEKKTHDTTKGFHILVSFVVVIRES